MPKRVTGGKAHLRGVALGQHSSEETSQRWRAVDDTASDLTSLEIEPRTLAWTAKSLPLLQRACLRRLMFIDFLLLSGTPQSNWSYLSNLQELAFLLKFVEELERIRSRPSVIPKQENTCELSNDGKRERYLRVYIIQYNPPVNAVVEHIAIATVVLGSIPAPVKSCCRQRLATAATFLC